MTGQPSIVPYFSDVDAKAAMTLLVEAFGFETVQAFGGPDGRVMQALEGLEWSFGSYQPQTNAPDWKPL